MRSPEEYRDGLTGTNEKYDERGSLGSYRTSADQFSNPSDVVTFAGFGANHEDLVRGYCKPTMRELPEYDKVNYEQRLTEERVVDEDVDNGGGVRFPKDVEFRQKDRVTTGLFARPHIPNER